MSYSLDDVWIEKIGRLGRFSLVQQRRIYRIILICTGGLSYLFDTLLLLLFAFAGTINFNVPLIYGLAGMAQVIFFSILHWTGFSERFANPHMPFWQLMVGLIVQMVGMAIAPELVAFFMALVFLVFGFCALRISLREALIGWLFASLSIALVISYFGEASIGIVSPSHFEIALVWIAFASILLRSIGLGYYASMLRLKIYERTHSLESAVFEAEHLATHDLLTGTLNRRVIVPALSEQISLCKRKGIPACVVMIDLDRFKSVNDKFGHLVGDDVLRMLAKRINGMIRDIDKFGRYGGEEFLLLLPATTIDLGLIMAERIREDIASAPWSKIAQGVHMTISCGVTEIKPSDIDLDVIARADHALYEAKHKGRNRVCSLVK
jgi:diguanylate cyclase (GGDEF)-like protein